MGSITIRRGGRPPTMAYVDGELMFIKKIGKVGSGRSINIPSEWFTVVSIRYGKEPTKLALDINADDATITIKPYFDDEGSD
jgi:hypothetical protein